MIRAVVIGVGLTPAKCTAGPPGHARCRDRRVADVSDPALKETTRVFNVGRTFRDHREMLDQLKPDVAYVLTMPKHTCALVLDCLERGIHTFSRSLSAGTPTRRGGCRGRSAQRLPDHGGVQPSIHAVLLDSLHQLRSTGRRRSSTSSHDAGWNAPDDVQEHSHFVESMARISSPRRLPLRRLARWLGGDVRRPCEHRALRKGCDMDWALQLEFTHGEPPTSGQAACPETCMAPRGAP